MGSFRDIVRSRRGPGGRIDEFRIGLRIDPAPGDAMSPYEFSVAFHEQGSEPVASSLRFQFDSDAFLELRSGKDGTIVQIPDHAEEISGVSPVHAMFMLDFLIDSPDWSQHSPGFPNLKPITDYLYRVFPRQGIFSDLALALPPLDSRDRPSARGAPAFVSGTGGPGSAPPAGRLYGPLRAVRSARGPPTRMRRGRPWAPQGGRASAEAEGVPSESTRRLRPPPVVAPEATNGGSAVDGVMLPPLSGTEPPSGCTSREAPRGQGTCGRAE